mmetsp:Transcript_2530/g.3881  ORF Transcript_2530/g.3881 Transcript_2530/m.3881 type:complete len:172 (-) Transcript_2530:57-572(-)
MEGTKRKKPLPEGYVCNACGGNDHPIYECAQYKSKKKARKPPMTKHFLWGLPQNITSSRLKEFLLENNISGEIIVKLIMDQSGEKCRGVGFVTTESSESETVLALDGIPFDERVFHIKLDQKEPKQKPQRCYRCGEKHEASECTNNRICYRCKSSDHISSECPLKTSKKKE